MSPIGQNIVFEKLVVSPVDVLIFWKQLLTKILDVIFRSWDAISRLTLINLGGKYNFSSWIWIAGIHLKWIRYNSNFDFPHWYSRHPHRSVLPHVVSRIGFPIAILGSNACSRMACKWWRESMFAFGLMRHPWKMCRYGHNTYIFTKLQHKLLRACNFCG